MNQKYKRLYFIIISLSSIAIGLWFISKNFKDNIVFFYTPTELKNQVVSSHKVIRVGGLVLKGSIKKLDSISAEFIITDQQEKLLIRYKGILPNLFRDGQGIVAKGKLAKDIFIADEILAKHDENYIPKEVYSSIRNKNCSNCS